MINWLKKVFVEKAAKTLCILIAISVTTNVSFATTQPKLIVHITVDGLRGDFPTRFQHVLGKGGFRYLLDKGVNYRNAHYQHGNTETIVGHVSLATGAIPATHGMVGNVWFNRDESRLVYNIEDPGYTLLSANADVDQDSEIDPTQKAAKVEGRSPNNILCTTFIERYSKYYKVLNYESHQVYYLPHVS